MRREFPEPVHWKTPRTIKLASFSVWRSRQKRSFYLDSGLMSMHKASSDIQMARVGAVSSILLGIHAL